VDIQPWPAPKSVMSRMTRCRRRALVSARLFRRLPVSDARIVEPGGDQERGIHSTARWPTAPLHLRGVAPHRHRRWLRARVIPEERIRFTESAYRFLLPG
jgi:hypothetical protein